MPGDLPDPRLPQTGYSLSNPGTGQISIQLGDALRVTNNASLASATVITITTQDRTQPAVTANVVALSPGGSAVFPGFLYAWVQLSTSSATTGIEYGPLIAIVGPHMTGKGTVTAAQSGAWSVSLADSSGNPIVTALSNAGTAGANGIAHGLAAATATDTVTLSDGTSTENLFTSGATEAWVAFSFPVVSGKTYTLAGTGLVILSGAMIISPS